MKKGISMLNDNDKEKSIAAFVPASLFLVLVLYLLMSDPFITGPF
jgi:hypothetical protein